MTSFVDGPAAGIPPLMLRQSPLLLRVVRGADGKWGALDSLQDGAGLGDEMFLYILNKKPGSVQLRATGTYRAVYRFSEEQPAQEIMRDDDAWGRWCETNRKRLLPQWYRLHLKECRDSEREWLEDRKRASDAYAEWIKYYVAEKAMRK